MAAEQVQALLQQRLDGAILRARVLGQGQDVGAESVCFYVMFVGKCLCVMMVIF